MSWKTYSGIPVEEPLPSAVERIITDFSKKGQAIRICIGTDSQVKGPAIDMVTVIVFLVVGNGGFMYVKKQRLKQRMSLRERMLSEVGASIETAWQIYPIAEKYGTALEVHADINKDPRHPSYQALHDASGYVKGMGLTFIAKPDAFASSVCADRLCH